MTAYEARYGKVFDLNLIEQWGCLVVEHLKPEQRKAGKNANKGKKGIFHGYGYHKGYGACQ
eukprot:705217-Rhodomonas_salina.1